MENFEVHLIVDEILEFGYFGEWNSMVCIWVAELPVRTIPARVNVLFIWKCNRVVRSTGNLFKNHLVGYRAGAFEDGVLDTLLLHKFDAFGHQNVVWLAVSKLSEDSIAKGVYVPVLREDHRMLVSRIYLNNPIFFQFDVDSLG